jgi:hypothetical protein
MATPPGFRGRGMRSWQVLLASLTVLVTGLGVVAPSAGAQASARGWSKPVRLSAAGRIATDVQLAADKNGAVAAWVELGRGVTADGFIMASQQRPGGGWARPARLSPRGQIVLGPQVAANGPGAAVAVWVVAATGSGHQLPFIQAAFRRRAGGSWSRPTRISPAGAEAGQTVVGIGGDQAIAVWDTLGVGGSQVQWSALSLRTGRWSVPAVLARTRQSLLFPQIAMDARGDAVAAWRRHAPGPLRHGAEQAKIVAAVRPAGHRAWRAPVTLGAEFEPAGQGVASLRLPGPRVAIGARGQAVVVWQGMAGGTVVTTAATRSAAGPWRQPMSLTARLGVYPAVAMNAAGDVVAVWESPHQGVSTASKPARARRWSAPHLLSRGNPNVEPFPEAAVGHGGEAVAVWSDEHVRAAVRPGAAASWRAPATLGPGGLPQVTFTQDGLAITAWPRPESSPMGLVIQAATYGR